VPGERGDWGAAPALGNSGAVNAALGSSWRAFACGVSEQMHASLSAATLRTVAVNLRSPFWPANVAFSVVFSSCFALNAVVEGERGTGSGHSEGEGEQRTVAR